MRIKPRAPYDFALTVHKPAGWPLFSPDEVFEDGRLWTARRMSGKLVGLRLSSAGGVRSPLILIDVFLEKAPSDALKDEIAGMIRGKLYADEPLAGFYRMASRDPILRHAVRHRFGMQYTDSADLYSSAILAVCLQMAPMARSEQMMDCLLKSYGDSAEFDGKRIAVWPSAGRMAGMEEAELKRCKLGYRAKYLIAIAKKIDAGFPSLDDLKRMSAEEAKRKLMELPGIGDYSSDIINPCGGFPIDVWSADVFGMLLFGREPEGRDGIERIKAEGIRRWGKWSWLAFLYVVQDLENLSDRLGIKLRLS